MEVGAGAADDSEPEPCHFLAAPAPGKILQKMIDESNLSCLNKIILVFSMLLEMLYSTCDALH